MLYYKSQRASADKSTYQIYFIFNLYKIQKYLTMELPYAVYILRCSDETFYTGFTTKIKSRLKAHNNKEVHYTKSRLPIELVQLSQFKIKQKAYDFERYLKSGSGIAFRNKRFI